MSDDRKPQTGKGDPNTLLGDLESIRSLLDEPEDGAEQRGTETVDSASDNHDDDVPILDDVVTGAIELNEPDEPAPFEPSAVSPEDGLDDETIKALLDDEWRERAGDLLGSARDDIESNSDLWQPEYTDELGEALQVRIDDVVHGWIGTTLNNNIDSLRQALISALQSELDDQLRRHLGNEPDADSRADD